MKHYKAISQKEYNELASRRGAELELPIRKKNNAWRVLHKSSGMCCTTVGMLGTVKKAEAQHWAEQFERVAPHEDTTLLQHAVIDSNLHQSYAAWMKFRHSASWLITDAFTEFWPSEDKAQFEAQQEMEAQ